MKIQSIEVTKLVPYERNTKKHPKEQVKKIAESIAKTGWDQPIVVDENMVIIKGHGRRLAAIELGLKVVPVLVRDDLSEEQVKAARLLDNRAALSDIDTELLKEELASFSDLDMLRGVFEEKELDFLVADLGDFDDTAFIDDMDAAVNDQEEKTKEAITEVATKRVSLIKAFGFKDVPGSAEIVISRFMQRAKHETGLEGADALVEMLKRIS